MYLIIGAFIYVHLCLVEFKNEMTSCVGFVQFAGQYVNVFCYLCGLYIVWLLLSTFHTYPCLSWFHVAAAV